MPRLALIIAAIVLTAIVEIAVLIAVGSWIGIGWTLLLLLATSALGAYLLRREGTRAWRTFRADLAEQRPPGTAATDGVLVLLGGVFMLVPGFVTDVVGLLLLLPPTRKVTRGWVQRFAADRLSPNAATSLFGPRKVRVRYGDPTTSGPTDSRPGPRPPDDGGPAIEGEIMDR